MTPPLLSVVTITNGDPIPFINTCNSFSIHQEMEWIVVTSDSIPTSNYRGANKIVYGSNKGIFAAMNAGLDIASGEICLFMNAGDEFFSPETIDQIIDSYKTNRWNWMVGGALIESNLKRKTWKPPKSHSWRFRTASRSFCHQSTVAKTETLLRLGAFDEDSLISDWIMSLRLSLESDPFTLDSLISKIEPGGQSSKLSTKYRIFEPHRLKKLHGCLIVNVYIDLLSQLISVISANFVRLYKKFSLS